MQEDITAKLIVSRLDSIHQDLSEIRTSVRDSLKDTREVVTKLGALETSHIAMSNSVDRLERQLEKERDERKDLEKRIDALEKDVPMQKQIHRWILSAIWGAAILVAGFVAKFVGLL